MRRIVFITQQVDPADPVLAATVPKVRALARRLETVTVLALGGLADAVPANVTVRRFGAGAKVARGARFTAALAAELARRPRPDAVVAHMCPIYAVLAAPLVRPLGIPLLLWFTHWNASPTLRVAERVVDRVVSVERRSFPLPSRKVVPIGHGIDVAEFPCRPPGAARELRMLALGRYSPAKGLDVVLRGLRQALDDGLDATLAVHGSATTAEERSHRSSLEELRGELALGERARLDGPVPRAQLPGLFAAADVLVNNMRAGAPDKVVYEAAAGCLPVLASNPVFDGLVAELEPPLQFAREDPGELAARLRAFAALAPGARAELGRALRARVEEAHSVDSWAAGVLEAARPR